MAEILSTIFYCLDPVRIEVLFDDDTVKKFYDVETYTDMFPDRKAEAEALFNHKQIIEV